MSPELRTAVWRKSSRTGGSGGQCVEIAMCSTVSGVRDSKDPRGPVLEFRRASLVSFLNNIKMGD
ncbi:DUF397 domain-containing protein [Umezawaea tangerina]|uniref:Uncharacterized protein DUF397 n=1 Tax=Umezawaea tangerina TaxID=84725 RepID=A0A2T0SPR4_9PSEU|nr:DUF397 domain-containing protein [Umezawaea tangerina]PRY35398.1 uncharacterized protein DUF397 [Umezawaea tangerina]